MAVRARRLSGFELSDANVKRATLSILGGVAFPVSYSILAGPVSTLVEDNRLRLLLYVPVGWPRLLCFYFVGSLNERPLFDNEIALLAYIVVCNVVLYTLMTYFVLLVFPFKRVVIKEIPPPYPRNDL